MAAVLATSRYTKLCEADLTVCTVQQKMLKICLFIWRMTNYFVVAALLVS